MYHVSGCIEGTVFQQSFDNYDDACNYECSLEYAGATDIYVNEPDY